MIRIEVTPTLKWEDIYERLKEDEVIVMRDGQAIALVSDVDADELYWRKREQDPEFIASIARAREQFARGESISHEDLKKELEIE